MSRKKASRCWAKCLATMAQKRVAETRTISTGNQMFPMISWLATSPHGLIKPPNGRTFRRRHWRSDCKPPHLSLSPQLAGSSLHTCTPKYPLALFHRGENMRYFVFPGLVILICLSLPAAQSGQQSKKPETLAILASAKFVFVEAYDGPDSPGSVRDPVSLPRTGKRWQTSRTSCRSGVITY